MYYDRYGVKKLEMSYHKAFRVMFFVILICGNTTLAQKKTIYINDDLEEVTKEIYELPLKSTEYYGTIEQDSLIYAVRVNRVATGQLSPELHNTIKNHLDKYSSIPIGDTDDIVINYYPGKDPCNSGGDRMTIRQNYARYLKKISAKSDVRQFFIYKSSEGVEKYGKKLKWHKDPSGIIESTFLKLHHQCGSYVIIRSDGSYFSHKGEHNIDKIIKTLE